MGTRSLFLFAGKTLSFLPSFLPYFFSLAPTSQGSGSDTHRCFSPEKTGKGPVAHKDTLGCASGESSPGEDMSWQKRGGIQAADAVLPSASEVTAGPGLKLRHLVTKPSPSGHDKPSQRSVRSPTKAANGTIQGAQHRDVGVQGGEFWLCTPLEYFL